METNLEAKIEINMPNVEHKQQQEIVDLLTKQKEKPTFKLYEKIVIGFSVAQAVESFMLVGGTLLANYTDVLSAPVKEVVKQSPYVLMTLSAVNLALVAGLFGGFKYKERRDRLEEVRVENEVADIGEKHKLLQEDETEEERKFNEEIEEMRKDYDVDEESNSGFIKANSLIVRMNIFAKSYPKKHETLEMEMEEVEAPLLEKPIVNRNPLLKAKAEQDIKESKQEIVEEVANEEEALLIKKPGK